jgi:hypothetical protein
MLTGVDVAGDLAQLREFMEKAAAFQVECIKHHDRLAALTQTAGRVRRQLVEPSTRPPEPA